MKIIIVGTGYVGLVSGACFAEMGNDVTCVDTNAAKIEALRGGTMPIFEPGLAEMVARNVRSGRLHFSASLPSVLAGAEVIFSAVGTPPGKDDAADLSQVLEVARTVGRHAGGYFVLATKSTVPVGTAARVRSVVAEELAARGLSFDFDVVSNPEFLKEGAAVKDFMSPDRVVVGVDSARAAEIMERLYKPFMLNGLRLIYMDIPSAEMTKYASNAMLAARISFMNEIAALCEAAGADVEQVRRGMGADPRIGSKFLYAGAGYGGSCFPKDVKALVRTGVELGVSLPLIGAVEQVNNRQKHVVFNKLREAFGSLEGRGTGVSGRPLEGRVVAVWGLAFKPETDDVREAPALVLVRDLLAAGALVRACDPAAMESARAALGSSLLQALPDTDSSAVPTWPDAGSPDLPASGSSALLDRVAFCRDAYDAAAGADAIALMTEWREFRTPSWPAIRAAMRPAVDDAAPILVDGRNIYDPAELEGFRYFRIGRK